AAQAPIPTLPDDFTRLASDITGLLRQFATRTQVVLFVDDFDLADELTTSVLEQLCLCAAEVSLILVLTKRISPLKHRFAVFAEKSVPKDFLYLKLDSLMSEDLRGILSYYGCSPATESQILSAAAGNPLFLKEYALTGLQNEKLSAQLE